MKTCLHTIPSAIEQHGAEWPEEWPKRLVSYPEWMGDKEKLIADTNHWEAIVNRSYLTGFGIEWSSIRNVMDMKAINGGYVGKTLNIVHKLEASGVIDIMTSWLRQNAKCTMHPFFFPFYCMHFLFVENLDFHLKLIGNSHVKM